MKIDCAYDELVDINKLVENPKNNNRHPKEQIRRLAKIIEFQGQRAPIVVSNRSGFVVKGHGRLEAIKLLGWEKAAVDYQDYDSEAQEYADMTADNQIAKWSEFDNEGFLGELPNVDIDLELFGLKDVPVLDMTEIDNSIEIKSDLKDDKEDTPYRITYELCFNDEIEQEHWYKFLQVIKKKYPEVETISERVLAVVDAWVAENE